MSSRRRPSWNGCEVLNTAHHRLAMASQEDIGLRPATERPRQQSAFHWSRPCALVAQGLSIGTTLPQGLWNMLQPMGWAPCWPSGGPYSIVTAIIGSLYPNSSLPEDGMALCRAAARFLGSHAQGACLKFQGRLWSPRDLSSRFGGLAPATYVDQPGLLTHPFAPHPA